MLELLYATGLRVSELVGLPLARINLLVRVLGKGERERLLAPGRRSSALGRALPSLMVHCQTLFLSHRGEKMTR